MKSILILLIIAILTGCASSNSAISPDNNTHESYVENIESLDSTKIIEVEVLDTQVVELVEELKRIPPLENRVQSIPVQIKKIKKKEQTDNLQVIDRTADSTDTRKGWIAYSVPNEMKVSKNYSVKVRISKKTSGQSKYTLILGREDAINNPDYPTVATIEDVRVSGEMSAELRGDLDDFKIISLSTPNQNIDDESYTEWEWIVTPKKSGQSPLKLVIKVKESNKDIIVFNKQIKIKSNMPVAVEGFFEKYWQWFMTTIIIPIFIWFWNRKKKRQTKKS